MFRRHLPLLRMSDLLSLEEKFVVVATNYCFLKQLLQRIMADFSSGVEIGQYVFFFFWFSNSLIFFGVVAIMNKFDTLYCRVNQIVTTFDGLMRWKLNWKGSVRLKKERMKI